jgi:hypothetical protein
VIFVFSKTCRPSRGAPGVLFSGYLELFIMARGVDHSHPCGAEVKNKWSHAAAAPLYLHDVTVMSYFYMACRFLD